MPHHYGLSKDAKCAQKDEQLHSFIVRGIYGVDVLVARQHLPSSIDSGLKTRLLLGRRAMIHYVDA